MSNVQSTSSHNDKENKAESSECLELTPVEEVLRSLSLKYTPPAQRESDGEHRSDLSVAPDAENSTQEGNVPRKDGGDEWETIKRKNKTVQTSSSGTKTTKTGDK
ncbi:hypothetical protein FKM82_029812 [Ascaphus truei]